MPNYDPLSRTRRTVTSPPLEPGGAPVVSKVYTSVQGALYACLAFAGNLEVRARIGASAPGETRVAAMFQRSNFSEFVVGEPRLQLPGDWWCCVRLEQPERPGELLVALAEAGNADPGPGTSLRDAFHPSIDQAFQAGLPL